MDGGVNELLLTQLKAPIQFDLLARLIKNLFCKKIKPTCYPPQHDSSSLQLLYVVFVKSSDKLLNYLMFGQTLIQVKTEFAFNEISPLVKSRNLSFHQREDGSQVHFRYPLF